MGKKKNQPGCPCCGGCDHGGVCFYVTQCGADATNDPVPVALYASTDPPPSGTPLAGSAGSGAGSGSGGGVCATWAAGAGPPYAIADIEVGGCTLLLRADLGTGYYDAAHSSTYDACLMYRFVDLCFASVTLAAYDVATGDPVANARVVMTPVGMPGGVDLQHTSCETQPVEIRRVGMVNYPGTLLAGSTCTDAPYPAYVVGYGGGPVPADLRVAITVSPARCDGVIDSDPTGRIVAGYLWECPYDVAWCCADAEFRLGGLPMAGDASWVRRVDATPDYCDLAAPTLCPDCRAAADMAFDNSRFLPRTVHLTGSIYWNYPAGPLAYAVGTADVDELLTIHCASAEDPGTWVSDPVAVAWPIGVQYCQYEFGGGVVPGSTRTIHATSVRFRGDWVDPGPGAYGAPGRVWVEFLADDFDPSECASGTFAGAVDPTTYAAKCTAGFDTEATRLGIRNYSYGAVDCPSPQLFVGWQSSPCLAVIAGDLTPDGIECCDSHVDWTWSCDYDRYTSGSFGHLDPPLCLMFGTLSLVGPA